MILALALTLCPAPPAVRFDCVHDADTFWVGREKIRIENIDTPELAARCQRERDLAIAARDRLLVLLNSGTVEIARTGEMDPYGRTLAFVRVDGVDVAEVLIAEGLAREWNGRRESWCE